MPEDNRPDDEKIGAWLDGELDSDGATGMTLSSATDPAFAARAERLRQIDGLIRAAVPEEGAIPDHLLERLGLAETKPNSKIVSMASFRRARDAGNDNASRGGFGLQAPWQMAAQIALAVAVGIGGIMLAASPGNRGEDAPYRTLGDKIAPAELGSMPTNALVIFVDGTDSKTAREIVERAGGKLVGTPNEAGAWKVALSPEQRVAALAALRKDSRIALAEPMDGGVR